MTILSRIVLGNQQMRTTTYCCLRYSGSGMQLCDETILSYPHIDTMSALPPISPCRQEPCISDLVLNYKAVRGTLKSRTDADIVQGSNLPSSPFTQKCTHKSKIEEMRPFSIMSVFCFSSGQSLWGHKKSGCPFAVCDSQCTEIRLTVNCACICVLNISHHSFQGPKKGLY